MTEIKEILIFPTHFTKINLIFVSFEFQLMPSKFFQNKYIEPRHEHRYLLKLKEKFFSSHNISHPHLDRVHVAYSKYMLLIFCRRALKSASRANFCSSGTYCGLPSWATCCSTLNGLSSGNTL